MIPRSNDLNMLRTQNYLKGMRNNTNFVEEEQKRNRNLFNPPINN